MHSYTYILKGIILYGTEKVQEKCTRRALNMLSALVLVACLGLARGITDEEAANFGTTGMPEQNTGIVGMVSITPIDGKWRIESNNIPDHDTGNFPGPDNPNAISEQSVVYTVPKFPQVQTESTCLPMGPIGIAVNGIVLYNPWDDDGENAVEGEGAEVFDMCDGHPDIQGRYHYHRQPANCLFQVIPGQEAGMVGVALDGFAIYGPEDEHGNTLTSADLDECHGRYNSEGVYQYHTTADFPYILGCFRGTPRGVETGGRCYKASDADEYGNVPGGGGPLPPFPQGAHPRSRRSNLAAHARIPANLFQRKLPTGYREFLEKVIFRQ